MVKPGYLDVTGKPSGIASHALIQVTPPHVSDHERGDFLPSIGGAPVCCAPVNQIATRLARNPRPSPQLNICRRIESHFASRFEEFKITGYDAAPAVRAQIAV